MSLEEQLHKRFEHAVREGIKPNVLYGPKWLQPDANGRPGEFVFLGTSKIAKASGRDLDRVILFVRQHLDLSDLPVAYTVDADGVFRIKPGTPAKPQDTPAPPADRPASPAEAAAKAVAAPPPQAKGKPAGNAPKAAKPGAKPAGAKKKAGDNK